MLVEITEASHDVLIDLKYATFDNVTGQPIYGEAQCWLHEEAAALLRRAVDLADQLELRFRIFDAFRPTQAQWRLWDFCPDPVFFADPRTGSPHSRGAAIDLTLIGPDGVDLDMGTGFDEFSPRSHHGARDIGAAAQRNRALLLGLMTAAGWDCYRQEWWHYQLFNPRRLPLLADSVLPRPMMAPPAQSQASTARTPSTSGT